MATKKQVKRKSGAPVTSPKSGKAAARQQMLSIIWFAVAIFLMCVVLVPGENVWNFLHTSFYGIFGITAFFYPVLLGVIAVMCALDKFYGSISAKVIESGVLVVLIGAAVDIFLKHQENITFWKHLSNAFLSGKQLKSGGFLGALIGQPLYMLFGKNGAVITIIILMFVCFMIITGTTLIALFKAMAKPVQKIEEHAADAFEHRERAAVTEKDKKVQRVARIEKSEPVVDIPVDDIPEVRKAEPQTDLSEKQRQVIETYNGAPIVKDEDTPAEKELPRRIKLTEEEQLKEEAAIEQEIAEAQKNADMVLTESEGYRFPPVSLLTERKSANSTQESSDLNSTASHLVDTLRSFGVETRIVDITKGPTVTRYELQPCAGVKISRITSLADDIALSLASAGVRIEAPIPNKAAVGIEVPNKQSNIVSIKELIESEEFTAANSKTTVALGRDISGKAVVADIEKMPHCLIAGATGSGKSVCINSIVMSILYKAKPEDVKLIMIDPKVVELGVYNGIPHLLVPVVTDPRKASGALSWAVCEMEKRYACFAENYVRNIEGYNRLAEMNSDTEKMPHIIIIIDELADLMMTAPKEVEDSINRIAAKARAAGMHLLIATQRPSVDVVTGVIKANIPTRIAFAVSSQIDSRTILDMGGAEKLLGRGDMLFCPMGASKPGRIQGCFVSDDEVEKVVEYIKADHSSDYDEDVMAEIERQSAIDKKAKSGVTDSEDADDEMLPQAIEVVVEMGQASTSMLQRRLKLGYARAARLIDIMEQRGVVGPYEGSKPRQVLISKEQLLEMKAGEE